MRKRSNTQNLHNEREKAVLKAVVTDFVQTALPVSSKQVQDKYISDISSATIRNVMADLEGKGFLIQPHFSAGRIPTDNGYRQYVDSIIRFSLVQEAARRAIETELSEASSDMSFIMEKTSRLLSELTQELAVVVAPKIMRGIFEKIDLISVSGDRILVVIQIRSGLIRTIVLDIATEIKPHRLPLVASILNERLYGVSLHEIIDTIGERFFDLTNDKIVSVLINKAHKVFNFNEPHIAKLSGTPHLMSKPDFTDVGKLGQIVSEIENGTIIASIFANRKGKTGTSVSIGSENENDSLFDFSVITKDYYIGDATGLVAVLGPKRMNYPQMIPLVEFMADQVTTIMNEKR
ncbi:MAG: heat-inducible transcriptional repressor HrcA [Candidatus Marinimicrobia bacterium]|nr:heat-inducible transcriptional repressor HrcA [Candidatus Neomarinimicrobiota bacterium]